MPLIVWFGYRRASLPAFLPNDYLYYAWQCLWAGSLATWVLPSVWWALTFAGVRVLDVIYSAWLEYAVSNAAPFIYLITLLLFIVADVKLIPVEATPGIAGVTQKEATATTVVYAIFGAGFWLLTFFLGKDAIMFVDYTLLDPLEWDEPGYLSPSLFHQFA